MVMRRGGAVAPDLAPRPVGQRITVKDPAGKTGIVLILQGRPLVVLGAGTGFGNAGDDFFWMDAWSVMKKGKVQRGAGEKSNLKLRGDALSVRQTDGASGLIYWDRHQFRWYQQGD